ncbi:MAG: glycosyl transferase family 1, partial [Verrucomicrobia bacterium]|nr:glycosyl transferase family 1 [Verrucomicrobiota bacterium]
GRKVKVLFVGEGVTLAHVLRPLTLAGHLDPEVFKVFFACDRRCAQKMPQNICHVPIRSIIPEVFQKRLAIGVPVYTEAELRSYVMEEIRLLVALKPAVVVGDFRVTLSISCAVMGIPFINLTHAHWSPYSQREFPVPEHPVVQVLGETIGGSLFQALKPLVTKGHFKGFNDVRKTYGLMPVASLEEMYTAGNVTAYLDLPSMARMSDMPLTHRFLGPVLAEPDAELPQWWGKWREDRPVVFVSPGSSGNARVFERVVRALAGQGMTVLLATAGRMTEEGWPEGVFAATYLPGKLAARVAEVVVCNGGSGMVYMSLAAGRPVLCVPQNADQYFISGAVQEAGAGLTVRSGKASERSILGALDLLIKDESYAHAAWLLAQEIKRSDAAAQFTGLLIEVAGAEVPEESMTVGDLLPVGNV